MCNDDQKFTKLNNIEQSRVFTASKHYLRSSSADEINLKVKSHYSKNDVKLKDTMFIPHLQNNLMSVSRITINGYTMMFNNFGTTVKRKDGSTILTATKKDDIGR